MVVTTNAIVFSSIKYAEADLIVSCFTESSGLKSYLLRSVLKSRKGKVRASYFQPLTQLEITAVHRNKGTLERIREVKLIEPYKSLHTNVIKGTVVMFLAELLKTCIQEEEPNPPLFEYLQQSLVWLDSHDSIANFHILFLLKLSAYLGFYPDESTLDKKYFNLEEGLFEDFPGGMTSEEGPHVEAFKGFFGIDFDALTRIKLAKTERSDVLNLILLYYKLHLQAYKNPKSLLVLNQLFN
ncbi:MAG: DNA repair protein RecO [Bacteroidia bacterium]|nr:DNA repair protein RecO [Bacteroidia bacterium]NNF30662.1 DNA repair protein RecO [Flavobacteriaceae bacterium]MBT8277293.1 DNA repair protein RecO [Bacteroidia bacterium]NNJ80860.1 DNA repair protein RecO [Flavobacteriaceae bacterium]NNK54893.1 DNA repair protein RecO [Flavobacteriaceae bacterium]